MSVKKTLSRVFSLTAAALLAVSMALLCSCHGQKPLGNDEPIELPLKETRTITYWINYDNTYKPGQETYADHPFFQRLEDRTNIHIDFVVPSNPTSIGDTRNEWTQRIATGDTTDMVSHNWFVPDFEGTSIDSAIDEGVYYELTQYINVQMPNFNALRQQYAVIDKLIITPYNNILFIPCLTGVEDSNCGTPVTEGYMVRKDYLDELQFKGADGGNVPVTVEDWHEMLTAFKVQLGLEFPYWHGALNLSAGCKGDAFITCYGQAYELYLDTDGVTVRHGAIEEGTRKYITMMHEWYEEGLVSVGTDISRADKLNDEVGSWAGNTTDIAALKADSTNPNYELVAVPYPVLNVGDTLDIRSSYMPIGNREINSIYICQSYNDPALAAKWIDQLFSDEAYMEASYGVEGEDYTVDADGNISFTENILRTSEGFGAYMYGVEQRLYLGSMWADRDVLVNLVYDDDVKAAIEVWSQAGSERNIIRRTSLPFTEEEYSQLATFENNIWATQTGRLRGMITGEVGLDEWDTYVSDMTDCGLEQYVAVSQAAWDRYLAA